MQLNKKWLNSKVSIPQAVGTIAIEEKAAMAAKPSRFNTASGRYYCNCHNHSIFTMNMCRFVSIPQAVGTIAILQSLSKQSQRPNSVSIPQAVGTIAMTWAQCEALTKGKPVSIPQAVGTIAITAKIC